VYQQLIDKSILDKLSGHLVDLEIIVSPTLAHNIYNRSKS